MELIEKGDWEWRWWWKIGLFEEDEKKQISLLLSVSLVLFSVFSLFFGPLSILPQPLFIVVMQ
jgi:hypothetical protein